MVQLLFLAIAVLIGYVATGPHSGVGAEIKPIVQSHVFSIAAWELHTFTTEQIPRLFHSKDTSDVQAVVQYFKNAEQERALESQMSMAAAGGPGSVPQTQKELKALRQEQEAARRTVEAVIEKQIRDTLSEQGIYSPFFNLRFSFPPVDFILAMPPQNLVISPRDRIEAINETLLNPDTSLQTAEQIESEIEQLNLSALVTDIGGLGATLPTFVAEDMDLKYTLSTAVHEWLHQYLAFKPLGFLYVLNEVGIKQSQDVDDINETLADIVGNEIGNMVYDKYYRQYENSPSGGEGGTGGQPSFDFNAEMRKIRKQVDLLLSEGKIDEAEQYMDAMRVYLADHGYYIRKLNQAYFAFYGTYADQPTSINPIGAEMKQLRTESVTLKQFLDRASSLTSRQALQQAAGT